MQSNIMGKGSYFVTRWRSTLAERWVSRTLLKHKSKSAVFTLRVIQLFRGGMQSSLRVFVPLQEAVFGMVASIAAIKGNEPTVPHSTQRCASFLLLLHKTTVLILAAHGEVTSPWSWLGSGAGPAREGGGENRGHRGDTSRPGHTEAASRRGAPEGAVGDSALPPAALTPPSAPNYGFLATEFPGRCLLSLSPALPSRSPSAVDTARGRAGLPSPPSPP